MKKIYETGIDTNVIALGVRVGTVGTAYTSASIISSGGEQKVLAESNEESGNIASTNMGTASTLKNNYLIIRTIIDLSNVDPSVWPNVKSNLVIWYHLSGGFSGNQVYSQDPDDTNTSPEGKLVIVTKPIQLT